MSVSTIFNNKPIQLFLIVSLIFHGIILVYESDKLPIISESSYTVPKIRIVGNQSGKEEKLSFIKMKKKNIPSLKDLSFNQLPIPNNISPSPKKIKKLPIKKKDIKEFLKSSPSGYLSAAQALRGLNDPINDVQIEMEVPKGIKEDQLNKHEMVFYSFQKRTVLAYINSFRKELNDFERKNPHLRFPLTESKQKLAGRVVYDKNGDILRIESLQWTDIAKLQDFFMHVLKNMNSLPNPPKEILEDEKFAINFILSLNN